MSERERKRECVFWQGLVFPLTHPPPPQGSREVSNKDMGHGGLERKEGESIGKGGPVDLCGV